MDKSIQLDEPYKLEPNTKLIITVLPSSSDEREAWFSLSLTGLNDACSPEDDYPINVIKVANPDYARR